MIQLSKAIANSGDPPLEQPVASTWLEMIYLRKPGSADPGLQNWCRLDVWKDAWSRMQNPEPQTGYYDVAYELQQGKYYWVYQWSSRVGLPPSTWLPPEPVLGDRDVRKCLVRQGFYVPETESYGETRTLYFYQPQLVAEPAANITVGEEVTFTASVLGLPDNPPGVPGKSYEVYWEVDGEIVLRSGGVNEEVEVVRDNPFTFRFYTAGTHTVTAHIVYRKHHLDIAPSTVTVADSNPVAYGAGNSVSPGKDDLIYNLEREYKRAEAYVAVVNPNTRKVYYRKLENLTLGTGEIKYAWDKKDQDGIRMSNAYDYTIAAWEKDLPKMNKLASRSSLYLTDELNQVILGFTSASSVPDLAYVSLDDMLGPGIKLWGAMGFQSIVGTGAANGFEISGRDSGSFEVREIGPPEEGGWVRICAVEGATSGKEALVKFRATVQGTTLTRETSLILSRSDVAADVNCDGRIDDLDEPGDLSPGLLVGSNPDWRVRDAEGEDVHNVEIGASLDVYSGVVDAIVLRTAREPGDTGEVRLWRVWGDGDPAHIPVEMKTVKWLPGGTRVEEPGQVWCSDAAAGQTALSQFREVQKKIYVEGVSQGSVRIILEIYVRAGQKQNLHDSLAATGVVVEFGGTYGEGRKKFIVASFPPPRETLKTFTATIQGIALGAASLRYKRGEKEAEVAWSGGEAEITFVNGTLNCDIQAVDGPEKDAPTKKLEQRQGAKPLLTVSGVQQGDVLILEQPNSRQRDRVAVVKNFTWNDLGRMGIKRDKDFGKLQFAPPFDGLDVNFKVNIQSTIVYCLNQNEGRKQQKDRQTYMLDHPEHAELAGYDIPSARGVGFFPEDMFHFHDMIGVGDDLKRRIDTFRAKVPGVTQFDYASSGRRKAVIDAVKPLTTEFVEIMKEIAKQPKKTADVLKYHTYESADLCKDPNYLGVKLQGDQEFPGLNEDDPIRNIRTDFLPTSGDKIPPNTPRLEGPPENEQCPYHLQPIFIINREGKIEIFMEHYVGMAQQVEDALKSLAR